ncbi:serpin family protein [Endozoicomonas sp. ONNA2]|uniref:serpin family protein n=1 Tax=Endozoicomonas sp. ONNA2 TaxID=2828741 RepID=UPI002147C236|nr:serpin family protein [Endozoicomonas sp. ONNA2]
MDSIQGPSINSITRQTVNLPAASFDVTSKASDIVKKMIDKVSLGILMTEGDKSKVVCPASLSMVIGMLLASMKDNARKAEFLGITEESLTEELKTEIHKQLGKLSREYPFGKGPEQPIRCTNFIGCEDATRNEKLDQILSEHYKTEKLYPDNSCLADVAEAFVKNRTDGKIDSLFKDYSGISREQIKAILGSVFEIKCKWKDEFPEDRTAPDTFLCADGTRIHNVKMMNITEDLHFTGNNRFGAIAKEFKSVNGESLKLVLITPRRESATEINKLDNQTISNMIYHLKDQKTRYNLTLPKIKVDDSRDSKLLEKICQIYGTNVITAEDLSRLGRLGGHDLNIFQTITTSIDEKGAFGIVATAAEVVTRKTSPIPDCKIVCPSYIAIVDEKDNRLIELIIKDGSFFEFFEKPEDSPAEKRNCDEDEANNKYDTPVRKRLAYNPGEPAQNLLKSVTPVSQHPAKTINNDVSKKPHSPLKKQLSGKDLEIAITKAATSIKTQIFKSPFRDVDASTFVQLKLNLDNEFTIKSAEANRIKLSITIDSMPDAIKLKQRILNLIGSEHERWIEIWDISSFKVDVSFTARDTLLDS